MLRNFVAVLCGLLLSAQAFAQEKKTVLRVADSFPVGHYIVEYGTKYWMENVTRLTGGAIEFQYYPAEQLGKLKDMLSLAQSGVADITYVAPYAVSDKLPLSGVAELPQNFSTACAGTLAYWKLAKEGILAKQEYVQNNIRVLFAIVLPPYGGFYKKNITSLKDLEGLKLRANGAPQELFLRRLKAVPVRIPTPEVYEALSRGTIDGVLFPATSIATYNLHTLAKSATIGENFGSVVVTYVISENLWKKLPENVQKAMTEVGETTTRRLCAMVDKDVDAAWEKLKQQGLSARTFTPAEHEIVVTQAGEVGVEWAQSLDKRGKPGTETLNAFREALTQSR